MVIIDLKTDKSRAHIVQHDRNEFILFTHVVEINAISHYTLCVFAHWKLISVLIFHFYRHMMVTVCFTLLQSQKWNKVNKWIHIRCGFNVVPISLLPSNSIEMQIPSRSKTNFLLIYIFIFAFIILPMWPFIALYLVWSVHLTGEKKNWLSFFVSTFAAVIYSFLRFAD